MSGTNGKGARKVFQFLLQIMSGTSVLCLTPSQMRITTRRLDLCLAHMHHVWHQWKRDRKVLLFLLQIMSDTNTPCLAPMEKVLESITDLVPDYVWHQCFMSDTFANAHYHAAACFMSDTCDSCCKLCLAPVFYVWH